MFTYRDQARSTALTARSIGEATVQINSADASKFGSPTPEAPLRLAVFDPDDESLKGILLATGRSGSTLTIAGPSTGYSDFMINQNDVVANVIAAQDPFDLWANDAALSERIDALEDADYVSPADLSGYATTAVADGLNDRIEVLEATPPPNPVLVIARWVLAPDGDLTAGSIEERADWPVDFVPVAVTVNARENPVGGGFTFNLTVGDGQLFAADQEHPVDSTASASYASGFALEEIESLTQIGLEVTAAGSGVSRAVVSLYGREA